MGFGDVPLIAELREAKDSGRVGALCAQGEAIADGHHGLIDELGWQLIGKLLFVGIGVWCIPAEEVIRGKDMRA